MVSAGENAYASMTATAMDSAVAEAQTAVITRAKRGGGALS